MTSGVPGCHGVAVTPASLGLQLGWLTEPAPLAAIDVEQVEAVKRADQAELVWQLDESPAPRFPIVTSQLWQETADSVWAGNTLNLSLRVDHLRDSVTVAAKNGEIQVVLEALANIALLLVVQRSGALVLHGSAACIDGSAVLVCAESGSGKSSLLMGLVAAGWQALSEDQCTIDLAPDGRHRIWPGPSWVRLKRGAALPALVAGRAPRFEAVDKIAWDLAEYVAHSPARLDRIVLLEPPGRSGARLRVSCRGGCHRRADASCNLVSAGERLRGCCVASAGQARNERSRVSNAYPATTRLA